MPAGLFTTTMSSSSKRMSRGMSSAAAVDGATSAIVMAITSPSRHSELALTVFTRECVTWPSSMMRWICDRDWFGISPARKRSRRSPCSSGPTTNVEARSVRRTRGFRGPRGASGAPGDAGRPRYHSMKMLTGSRKTEMTCEVDSTFRTMPRSSPRKYSMMNREDGVHRREAPERAAGVGVRPLLEREERDENHEAGRGLVELRRVQRHVEGRAHVEGGRRVGEGDGPGHVGGPAVAAAGHEAPEAAHHVAERDARREQVARFHSGSLCRRSW